MEYTKGEWKVKTSPMDAFKIDVEGEGFGVAMVTFKQDRGEQLANAHLIAAAPDMYEALKGIMADLENYLQPYILERTVEALAKAEGK